MEDSISECQHRTSSEVVKLNIPEKQTVTEKGQMSQKVRRKKADYQHKQITAN